MAIIPCEECGREISDRAPACPHCGNPRVPAPTTGKPVDVRVVDTKKNSGCGAVILALAVVVVLVYACSDRGGSTSTSSAAPPPVPSQVVSDPAIESAAITKFKGMPGIRHAEWLDGDFLLAAVENGSSWQPVAEAACAHLRAEGKRGRFAVVVLEAGALRNKNWQQMARARCN